MASSIHLNLQFIDDLEMLLVFYHHTEKEMLGILMLNKDSPKHLRPNQTMLLKHTRPPKHLVSKLLCVIMPTNLCPEQTLTCYCFRVSLASIILLPAIPFTFSTNPPPASRASISSPPPILLPLMSTFGTVPLPVLLARAFCRPGPKGWVSSSTT